MFLDKVSISIRAGSGGDGHVSFFRDKLNMHGGPDGGDGGRGGDVIFIGTTRESNLISFRFTKKFNAPDGEKGGKRNCSGKSGEHLYIPVPLGTRIFNNNELLADITIDEQEFVALKGGAGGKGNAFFATARKRTPNFSQTGVKTKEYNVTLELATIADVGLVGFPNVGKSTLLSVISNATPKIANYHFTTLYPNIGVTQIHDQNIVVADIPGLVEGASDGVGLGHDFLRHIGRTRLLIHIVDISETEGRDAASDFEIINKELRNFSEELGNKPQILALNKCDVATPEQTKKLDGFKISAATGDGVEKLMKEVFKQLQKISKPEPIVATAILESEVDKNEFKVEIYNGEFFVHGPLIDNLSRGVVLSDIESFHYFQRRLEQSGVVKELKQQGMKPGDTVHVGESEFEWVD